MRCMNDGLSLVVTLVIEFVVTVGSAGCGNGCAELVGVMTLAANGRIESQYHSVSAYPFVSAFFSTYVSHIFGCLPGSILSRPERPPNPKPSPPGEGGTHVPLRMASSTMRRWRRLRRRERRIIAAETDSNRTSVARKVYTVDGGDDVGD